MPENNRAGVLHACGLGGSERAESNTEPDDIRIAITACGEYRELERFPARSYLPLTVDLWGTEQRERIV